MWRFSLAPALFSTGQYLLSGSHDGSVLVWDTSSDSNQMEYDDEDDDREPFLHPVLPYKAHEDTVNGIR